jgi:hypothetical protein
MALAAAFLSVAPPTVVAEVSVAIGPTSIPRGDAVGVRDITVTNDRFAIAIAVDSIPPWGVARGGIIDIAPLRNGEIDYDIASLADFMPNKWSNWPTTYQRIDIVKQSTTEAIIRTVRDWGEVDLETMYHIRDGDSKIRIVTRMTNNGEADLTELVSGYVVWPDGGSLFGMPGLPGTTAGSEEAALGDWSAAYGEHWVLGLHAPFSQILAYDGRDRYLLHDLAAGETRTFEAWLQIENDGSLAPLVEADIAFGQLPFGRISGHVTDDDQRSILRPAVVVTKDGVPYAWTLGSAGTYALDLPVGQYEIFATARGHSRSEVRNIVVHEDCEQSFNFDDVPAPGRLQIQVSDAATGRLLDARITIRDGHRPTIGFFGKRAFFTELDTVGETTQVIAPGKYVFEVSAGGGFTSTPLRLEGIVESGATLHLVADIAVLARPQEKAWFNADMHHHSDVLDGFTKAEFVMRSELAAGVDLAFLSDHDSVANNTEMRVLAQARDIDFIAGTELSPSWAHFNAYPLDDGKRVEIDTGKASVHEIFTAAREMGADLIAANHPYSDYGYFNSEQRGTIPGGYDKGFDLAEIAPGDPARNRKTVQRVWQLWNSGQRVYLVAGSDAHDVWQEESGSARTYAFIDGDLTVGSFMAALKAGHSYATLGPLVYPEQLFGTELAHTIGDPLDLSYSIQAVSGLHVVQLVERGRIIATLKFDGERELVQAQFQVNPTTDTWFSLIVEDKQGKFAYTNPLWVNAE